MENDVVRKGTYAGGTWKYLYHERKIRLTVKRHSVTR